MTSSRPTLDELKELVDGDTTFRLSRQMERHGKVDPAPEPEAKTYMVEIEEDVDAVRRSVVYVEAEDADQAVEMVRRGEYIDADHVFTEVMDGIGGSLHMQVISADEYIEESS